MALPTLAEILDTIVEDIRKEFPEKDEFEAAFFAVQMHLSILTQMLATAGMDKQALDERELYLACSNLVQLAQWMAAKQLAAETMRQIEQM